MLVFAFFLCCWFGPPARLVDKFGHSFCFSLVSASVEHVRDKRGSLFCPSPCLCRSSREFILNQNRLCRIWCFVICVQIEKCNLVFPWCCSPGYFAPCPLGKFCQEFKFAYLDLKLENPRTLSSANPCLNNPRTLSNANSLFGGSAHSAMCETC